MNAPTFLLIAGTFLWSSIFSAWVLVEKVEPRLEALEETQGIALSTEVQP